MISNYLHKCHGVLIPLPGVETNYLGFALFTSRNNGVSLIILKQMLLTNLLSIICWLSWKSISTCVSPATQRTAYLHIILLCGAPIDREACIRCTIDGQSWEGILDFVYLYPTVICVACIDFSVIIKYVGTALMQEKGFYDDVLSHIFFYIFSMFQWRILFYTDQEIILASITCDRQLARNKYHSIHYYYYFC